MKGYLKKRGLYEGSREKVCVCVCFVIEGHECGFFRLVHEIA